MSQDPYKVYRTIARVGGVVLLVLGVLVLLGWLWNIDLFTTFLSGRITMKPNTAVGFVFLGIAFFRADLVLEKSQDPNLVRRLPPRLSCFSACLRCPNIYSTLIWGLTSFYSRTWRNCPIPAGWPTLQH